MALLHVIDNALVQGSVLFCGEPSESDHIDFIKQRFCRSGMRWKDKGIKTVLSLRSLVLTTDRWKQFWEKIDQYGVGVLA